MAEFPSTRMVHERKAQQARKTGVVQVAMAQRKVGRQEEKRKSPEKKRVPGSVLGGCCVAGDPFYRMREVSRATGFGREVALRFERCAARG